LPNVEIIYLSKENSEIDSLQPRVSIHENYKIEKPNDKKNIFCKKTKINHKKRFAVFFICFIILIPILATSYNAGFLPISPLLPIKEPIGNAKEITIAKIGEKYPVVKSIPEINSLKHGMYSTDEAISIVSNCYILEIEGEGYGLKYEGEKNIKGFNVHYLGFIKGLTAVVILMTDDDIDIGKDNTFVIYTTGSVFEYKSMIGKYGGIIGF
jgi:hypothetical protein